MTAYQDLEARFRWISLLDEAIRLLRWDAAAIMPEGGAGGRAEQLALLRLLVHETLTAPEISDLLAAAEAKALGALLAAQLFAAARREIAGLDAAIAAGRFAPLLVWLGERVHGKWSLLSTAELVESATGAPLGTESFEHHLRDRYLV